MNASMSSMASVPSKWRAWPSSAARCIRLGMFPLLLALHVDAAFPYVFAAGDVTNRSCYRSYSEGGSPSTFASGAVLASPGLGQACHGFASSSANESKGEFKAHAIAFSDSPDTVTRARTVLQTTLVLHGPQNGTQVKDTLDLVISGNTTPPLQSPAPYPNLPTGTLRPCIRANSPGLAGTIESFGCSHPVIGGGGDFAHTESLVLNVPIVNGQSDPIHLWFSVEGVAESRYSFIDPQAPWEGYRYFTGEIDMSHTALIRQSLPDGWTFTSDSGVFLSESPFNAPVPEPGTALLLIGGLGLLSTARRNAARRNHFASSWTRRCLTSASIAVPAPAAPRILAFGSSTPRNRINAASTAGLRDRSRSAAWPNHAVHAAGGQ